MPKLADDQIVIRKDSAWVWIYRGASIVATVLLVGLANRLNDGVGKLLNVPRQVEEQGRQITELNGKVDKLALDQAGAAKEADLKDIRGKVDKIDGRVQALENIYSAPEVPARRPK